MFRIVLALFIFVPIIEIYLLISVGKLIGIWSTLFLVIFTAILGTHLLRAQGLATLQKLQDTLQRGELPTETLLEGILLLCGGIFLLTPGFFTDALGFVCLIPVSRQLLVQVLKTWLRPRIVSHIYPGTTRPSNSSEQTSHTHSPTTIEGEYQRDD